MSLKVLFVSSEFPPGPGGIGNHAYSLCKALAVRNYKVFVVTNADYVEHEDVLDYDKKIHPNILMNRVFRHESLVYYKRISTVIKILKREGIDTMILSGKYSLWIGYLVKLLYYKVKTYAILHGSEVNLGDKVLRRLTHQSIAKADELIPVSEFTYQLLPNHLKNKQYTIISNGIDCNDFKLNENDRIENFIGYPKLLTVGNVTPRKGQHRVIKALPLMRSSFPTINYHIVGLPTNQEKLIEIGTKLEVQNNITFHGRLAHRSQVYAAYKEADCFIILSENQSDGDVEGFGIVVLEANYFGLPVIGARGCGIESAIRNGYNGILVDGDNPNEINEALKTILENRDTFSQQARLWAEKHDWSTIIDEYLAVIK